MPILQKIKRKIRRATTKLTFRPKIITNTNTQKRQLQWKGKIRGKRMLVKTSRTLEEHLAEKKRRLAVIKNLDKLQGDSYQLKVSKRYPVPNPKKLEQEYNLPTMFEMLNISQLWEIYSPLNLKIKKLLKKSHLPPRELHNKCANAYSELSMKIHSNHETRRTDIYSANVLVDIGEKGKIVFTLIDF